MLTTQTIDKRNAGRNEMEQQALKNRKQAAIEQLRKAGWADRWINNLIAGMFLDDAVDQLEAAVEQHVAA